MEGRRKEMSDKQKRFVEEYLIDLNATQAAIRAGYSPRTADSQGIQLLRNGKVKDAVSKAMAERSARTSVTAERVLREIAKLAFVNMDDIVDSEGRVRKGIQRDDMATVSCVKIHEVESIDGGDIDRTIEVKLYDKVKALDLLCKHLGMYDARRAVESADGQSQGVIMMPEVPEDPGASEDMEEAGDA